MARRPPGQQQRQINVFLLKAYVERPDEVIRTNGTAGVEDYPVIEALGHGQLFVRRAPVRPPGWGTFVRDCSRTNIQPLAAASPGALLIIKVDERWYGISFGQGRHLLDPSSFERQFGLKAALNLADPDSLGLADASEWDHAAKHKRISTARRGDIRSFDLNDLELLKGIVGTPRDTALGSQIAGRDSAMLWCAVTPTTLASKCRQLLAAYQQPIDANRYPMVGQVTVIDDPAERQRLNELFLVKVNDGTLPFLDAAPPEVVNWENTAGFLIRRPRQQTPAPSLELSVAMLEAVKPRAEWDIDWLRSLRVHAVDGNDDDVESWSAYNCLITEFDDGASRFALFAGDWLRLNPDFVARINNAIAAIPPHTAYAFPHARRGDHEGPYNRRVAANSQGQLLKLDRELITHGGGRSKIEVCDLLDIGNSTLYHVKDKYAAAGLSHLYTQAWVSAELLKDDHVYRRKVREAFPTAQALFPDAVPEVRGYRIVLGIISSNPRSPVEQMSFLGKVRLDNLKRNLGRMGFNTLELLTIIRD